MKRLKGIISRLLMPPGWLTALIAPPALALVIFVLATGRAGTPLAYLSYLASAYALVILLARVPAAVAALRGAIARRPIVQKLETSERGQRLLTEPMYRAELALYPGLAVNLLYAAVKLVSGILYRSTWFASLACYYLLLSALRYVLLNYTRRNPVGEGLRSEWKRYRLCGVILLLMNQALLAVVILMVYQNSGAVYPGYLIYVMALYTFYAVINAVRKLIKFRRHESPVLSAAKAVNLIAALVSLLSLETAMLNRFGGAHDPRFRRVMTGCTGLAVCAIVLAMAVVMIVRSTRRLRRGGSGEAEREGAG